MEYLRPTKKQLDSMTESELLERLLLDRTHAQLYRDAVFKLRAVNGGNQKPQAKPVAPVEEDPQGAPPDIRQMVEEACVSTQDHGHASSLRQLAKAILSSGWDYIDPDPKGMKSDPVHTQNFLLDFTWREKYWEDLVEKAQNKWNTIIDAYGRWWRNQ